MTFIRTKRVSAASLFSLLAGLLLLAVGCTDSAPGSTQNAHAFTERVYFSDSLLAADALLHRKLQALQEADKEYERLLDNPVTTELDKKNGQIILAEMALQQTLDSLNREKTNTGADSGGMLQLTGYFKELLMSRQSLADMRMIASVDSDDSTNLQKTLLNLRREIAEKTQRIAQLERAATTPVRETPLNLPGSATPLERKLLAPEASRPAGNDNYAQANGESIEQLKQRNQNLAAALNAVQTQYGTLSKYYRQLKQEYDRMQTELADLKKTAVRQN